MRVSGVPYVQGRNSYSDADGTKYGIAIHNTSNTASAGDEASYATRRTDGVSSHFYVDATKVIQSLDTTARAGHAGSGNGNQNAVAVEIRGVNGWSRQTWLDSVCWGTLGRVLADVCRAYGIAVRRASVAEMRSNPKVRAFYSHDDMRQAWGGTDHTDPGPGFPWDRLFSAVNAALNGGDDSMDQAQLDQINNADKYGWKLASLEDKVTGLQANGKPTEVPNLLAQAIKRIDAAVAVLAARPAVQFTDEQASAVADKVAAALAARPDTPLGDADKPAIVEAVKTALREGVGA
jgi:N-acetyl-anhydromuramyl-L-alanine amidase AmpD